MTTTATPPVPKGSIFLGPRAWSWKLWEGETLPSRTISLDTETELIQDEEIPRLALATACDGIQGWLIAPSDLGRLLVAHNDRRFVFQNVAFDFHVIAAHLAGGIGSEVLPHAADSGRVGDTMLLDMLIRLGRTDAYPDRRDLGRLAAEYANIAINKDDPYRLRYGEILGLPLTDPGIAPGFFSYAVADPIATLLVWQEQIKRALHIARRRGIPTSVIKEWGPLSHDIQVKAAISFATVQRNGMAIDTSRADVARDSLKARLRELYDDIKDCGVDTSELFKVLKRKPGPSLFAEEGKPGEPMLTPSGAPSLSSKELQSILLDVAADIEKDTGIELEVPRTDRGAVSTSAKEWGDFAHLHPFIRYWSELTETAKLLQFFRHFERSHLNPRYTIMVRTGRTSASNPNVQQIPRGSGLREVFVPTPGHFLLATDYAFIELRTLASVCEQRFGYSVLADVIRKGVDPHVYTAALVNGMEPEEFQAIKATNPARYKDDRQAAKAVNFGIPGGLGPRTLATLARRSYGVDMSMERAKELRDKLIDEVYPELGDYLTDDPAANLARSLMREDVEDIWKAFDFNGSRSPGILYAVRKVVHGMGWKADGTPYHPTFITKTWESLRRLNQRPELVEPLAHCEAGPELSSKLFYEPAVTLTGRVRGRVSYSQARNTPFQGLAADGGKLAVYRLVREGYRVVAFIHDEILVELPDRGGYCDLADVQAVERAMIEEMGRVVPGVPIGVESTLSDRWSKAAKLTVEGDKVIPWRAGN